MARKKLKYYTIAFIILFSEIQFNLMADQEVYYKKTFPEEINEKFIVFTDRNVYAVNETIFFKVFNVAHPLIKEKNWSKVFYIELLNREGSKIFQGKFELNGPGTDGYIILPEDLPTDYYFIVGYTKWMRNFSPSVYAITKITVINPFKTNIPNRLSNENPESVFVKTENALHNKDFTIECQTDKEIYSTREAVKVTFSFPKSGIAVNNDFCISVIKVNAIDSLNFGVLNSLTINNNSNDNNYLPEIYGLSISGKIVDRNSKEAVQNANVQMSVLGNKFDFFNKKTGIDGGFVFSLQPGYEKREIFISGESNENASLEILIDNDYSTKTLSFEDYPFHLTENEIKIAEEIMFNIQVQNAYNHFNNKMDSVDTTNFYFYGPPSNTVYIKKFIELPTLGEVFFELVPEVIILKKKGEAYLQVKGKIEYHPDFALFKPLVLMDKIPVPDIEELLKVSPTKISHIEVVNEIYIKGENKYGGIISVFSNHSDLAGIKLPQNSMFFNFNGFTPQQKISINDFRNFPEKDNIPDFRNCLYWEPNYSIQTGIEEGTQFYTSDVKGNYILLIRGVTAEGNVIEGKTYFRVE